MQPPSECLDTLKCSICNRLLSIFPVYVMQNENNQQLPVCGRCELPNKKKYSRCEIYENLAKAALFPCINKGFGCLINLLPKNMKKHELVCPYKLENCVVNECDWKGTYDDVLDHCQTNHNDLILRNNTFNLNMNENYDVLNFLLYEDEIFTFKYNYDHILKHLMCSLTHLCYCDKQRKYYAQINLTTEDASISKIFPEIDANKNISKSININMENMLNDKNTTIIVTIKIVSEQDQLKLVYDEQINKIVLSKLKCRGCNGLYESVTYCGSSQIDLYSIRHSNCSHLNSLLQAVSVADNVVKLQNFRCEFGCEFISNIKDLVVHYKRCFNKSENCLLNTDAIKCEWHGRRLDFVKHILKAHNESIINANQLLSLRVDLNSFRFLKYACHMFRLIVQSSKFELLWRVEVLSLTESSNHFKFEITIFNNKDDDKKIIIRERCADFEFSNNKTYSQSDTPCIFLRTDNIKDFIQNNTLSFKINIWK